MNILHFLPMIIMEELSFEKKMLWFEEESASFQSTVLKSLLRIEKKIKSMPDHATITDLAGELAETITGSVDGLGEFLSIQRGKSASEGGRKFTKKYRKH